MESLLKCCAERKICMAFFLAMVLNRVLNSYFTFLFTI